MSLSCSERPSRPTKLLLILVMAISSYAIAGSDDMEGVANTDSLNQLSDNARASMNDDESLAIAAMEVHKAGYANAVAVPALKRFASAAVFMEGASAAFEDAPGVDTLAALKMQFAETLALRNLIKSFEYGPIHSLGYAAAMDTPLDQGGLNHLLAIDSPDRDELATAINKPWLQGIEALQYLLDDHGGKKQASDFSDTERLSIHLLAAQLRQTARSLLDSWTEGHEHYPAYSVVVSTAGEAVNAHYLTVQAASEEILRGSINALLGVVEESLPSVADSMQTADFSQTSNELETTHAVLIGVMSSYTGQLLGQNMSVSQTAPTEGVGISHWVNQQDPELNEAVYSRLWSSLDNSRQLLHKHDTYEPDHVSSLLEGLNESVTDALVLLQGEVLSSTQLTAVAN